MWLPYTEEVEEDDLGAIGRQYLKWSKRVSEASETSEAASITFTRP